MMIWLSQTLKAIKTTFMSPSLQHILNIPEGWAGDHVTGNDFSKIVESPAKQNKEGANFQKLIIESKGNVRRI